MAKTDTANSDGTISVTSTGGSYMPAKIRKLLNTDNIAYIAEGKVAILFNPNTPIPTLKQELEFMQLLIEKRQKQNDTPKTATNQS